MMLNRMPGGRAEPRWNEFKSSDFKDCEWRVEEMEFLGVKDRYVMIRGTNSNGYPADLTIPGGLKLTSPYYRAGFVFQYQRNGGSVEFIDADTLDADSNTVVTIPRNPLSSFGDCRFLVIAKTMADGV